VKFNKIIFFFQTISIFFFNFKEITRGGGGLKISDCIEIHAVVIYFFSEHLNLNDMHKLKECIKLFLKYKKDIKSFIFYYI
jgi:hypothetical protein